MFTVQPSSTTAGSPLAPPVQVAIEDANGNVVTSATPAITVAIGTNPSGGVLSGTQTVNAVAGVATFGNLAIDKAGTGYTLSADDGPAALPAGRPPRRSTWPSAPATGSRSPASRPTSPPGSPLRPPVQVAVQDANGNTVPGSTATDHDFARATTPGAGRFPGP